MDDNARPHRAHLVGDNLEGEDIQRMNWPAMSPDMKPIKHACDALALVHLTKIFQLLPDLETLPNTI